MPELAAWKKEPITRFGLITVLVSGVGWLFDGYVINAWPLVAPVVQKDFGFSIGTIGVITSIYLVGYMLGTFFGGTLADYIGRRGMLTGSVIFYTIAGALTSLSTGFGLLSLFRFLTGTGAGMELPVGSSFITDAMPSRVRGRSLAVMNLGYPLGYLLAIGAFAALFSVGGWRIVFAVAIIPGLFALVIRLKVGESPRFLAYKDALQRGQVKRERLTTLQLFQPPYRRAMTPLILYWLGNALTFWMFTTFIPLYLIHVRGYSVPGMVATLGLFNIFYAVIPFVAGTVIDLVGRRFAGVLFALLAGIFTWVMTAVPGGAIFVVVAGIAYGCVAAPWIVGFTHSAESFPTELRGSAIGTAMGIGRIVAIVAPLIFAALAARYGYVLALRAGTVFWILAIIGFMLARETRGETHADVARRFHSFEATVPMEGTVPVSD